MSVAADRAEPVPSIPWALASLSLTMLLPSLGTSIANVGLPTLTRAFEASFQQVQWVVLAYLLATTALVVGIGRLGDAVGRRHVLEVGILVFTAASVACSLAPTLWLLIAARAVQGLGAAAMMALTVAFVGETVPKARTGSAMGLLGTMSAVGTALGPSLGGGLIAGFGWPSIFLVNLPLGILAFVLARRYLPDDRGPARRGGGIDKAGTMLLALTLGAYALAMTMGRGHFGVLNISLLVAAGIGVALFLRVEATAVSPLVRLPTFRNAALSAGFVSSGLVATVVMTTLVVGPFYLSGTLALDTGVVGLVMSSGPIVSALSGVPAGRLVDRLGAHWMTAGGLVAMAGGCSGLALMPIEFGIPGYVSALVVLTSGYALFQAANNTAVMTGIRPEERGVISGLLTLSRNLGLVTGASVMGAVFAVAGMQITFAIAAVLVAVALVVALTTRAVTQA